MPFNYNKDKLIYRTLSLYATSKMLLARFVLAALIINGIIHFNENPIVITIIVGVLTLMLLYVGIENIMVYENKFVYQYGSLIKTWIRRKEFYYKDIEQVKYDGIFSKGLDILFDRIPITVDPYNKIVVVLKDGRSEEIHSKIYKQDLKRAMKEIIIQLEKSKVK